MYFASNRFTGNGVQTQWGINFTGGYISQTHVKVRVTSPAGVVTTPSFVWAGPNTLEITPAVASGYALEIYRDTPKDLPLVDYTDGAILNESNLDRTAQQTVFATAEIYDRLVDAEELVGGAAAAASASAASATSSATAAASSATAAASSAAIAQSIETIANNAAAHAGVIGNPHGTTKGDIGLGSVDNTADASKPVSTAQQAAIDASAATLTSEINLRLPEIGTYSALRAYTGPVTAYYVRGVSNIFDGGNGVFRVAVGDVTSADNSGTILVDAVGRRWKREYTSDIQAGWFGARGDGVNDDAPAIQAAYNFGISLGGATVQCPRGVCKMGSTLVLGGTGVNQNSANSALKGAGGYATTLDFSTAPVASDGVQIAGAGRIVLQGFAVKNAKNFGINVNSGQNPGDPTYVSRFALRDLIVEGSTSHGIRMANTYMGVLDSIESRNNGGSGFYLAGNHTSITATRCWAGGDGTNPMGGNVGPGWFINGIIYSNFSGCGSDWNGGAGWEVRNCAGLTFNACGSESNDGEGWLLVSSLANSAGSPVVGIDSVSLHGCFAFNNSKDGANLFANFLGVVTADSTPASVTLSANNDLLGAGQTVSTVFNGTSGKISVFDRGNNLAGTRLYSGSVVNGDYLTAVSPAGQASALVSGISSNVGTTPVTLTLPAGDWDVWGIVDFLPAANTSITNMTAGISTVSATFGGQDTFVADRINPTVPGGNIQTQTPKVRIRSTGSTVVYLVAVSVFTVDTLAVFGSIFAERA